MASVIRPRIHLYALCWNEARMLPFFFRHYDSIVDWYFIFDNGSTDGSLELLKKHPKVSVAAFTVEGPSFVLAAVDFYNQSWKQSRGQAEWVIVCNIDEHLYRPDLRAYLGSLPEQVTLIIASGYEMVSEIFPAANVVLSDHIRTGIRYEFYDKPAIFRPDSITEINFIPGRHEAAPEGMVATPLSREVKLLHYKCLGSEYLVSRSNELRQGLREMDLARGWGHQYVWDDAKKQDYFRRVKEGAVQVL